MRARAVVERHRGAIGRQRHPSGDAAGRRSVGFDKAHRAKVGARVSIEEPKLISVHQKPNSSAIGRPRNLVGALRGPHERLYGSRIAHGRPDAERLAEAVSAVSLEHVRHGVVRGGLDGHQRAAPADEPSGREAGRGYDERGNRRRDEDTAAAPRGRGRQIPFSGHCASPCLRP